MIRPNRNVVLNFHRNIKFINKLSTSTSPATTTIALNKFKKVQTSYNQKRFQTTEPDFNLNKNLKVCSNHGYINASPFETIYDPNLTLDQYVWKNLKRWPNKIAAVCVLTGRKYTFAQLRDASAAFAVRLQKKFKLQPRDVLAVCLPNLPEYPIASFGAHEAGLVVTTVNPIYTADEIARQLTTSNAKLIICIPLNYDAVKKACEISKKNIPILCIPFLGEKQPLPENTINFFDMISTKGINLSDLTPSGITPDDIAFLPFSSGTTGLPKGVMLTHRNITINCEMVQAKVPVETYVHETTNTFQDIIPCVLPFFHIYGLTVCMISKLYLGCQLVTIPKFTPEDLLKSLVVYKGTMLNLVPPILLMLTNVPTVKTEFLNSVRSVMTGAAPIGGMDAIRFLEKFPDVQLIQGYGLTETSPVVILTPIGNKNYSSAGFLVSNTEAKIIEFNDPLAKGLGPNKTGELCVRGSQIMKGYLNNEEANSDIFLPDSWLRTGDVAHYDNEGYFYITDRMKELIKVKGFQVPPAELEEVLRSHPKVLDAAVFGINDEKTGEAPRAVIVPKKDVNVKEEEILNYVAEKVAPYKQLTGGIVFVKEIPKNQAGKILRRELKVKFPAK
ncbi:uncharacterized protein LOC129608084 [Condylostylus longicornis]|uniref:uncharacterized protein LOC129608084 n=1 Tax=Condylostylus longicornis TaxID=2530218 RepID=UPI00244DA51C|nr:uncharacterized protein LOC129608084 [Condylostylus longicornis]XP_055375488.1 uncharacterized protein LOC129608084 [Condylostylus longicornis]